MTNEERARDDLKRSIAKSLKEETHSPVSAVSEPSKDLIGALEIFKNKHSSGHTMGWGDCAGCDLLLAFHNYKANTPKPQVCANCDGQGLVCEDHPEVPWNGGEGCCGGAGMQCKCQAVMENK